MDNVINLNSFVAKKEQAAKEAEHAEYDALYEFIGQILENNPPEQAPFFAYSESDLQASTIDIAVMKLMDAITLLDNLGKKKEAHIINRVVADLLGVEEE
jgi:predicted TPR repeat methyltransferase